MILQHSEVVDIAAQAIDQVVIAHSDEDLGQVQLTPHVVVQMLLQQLVDLLHLSVVFLGTCTTEYSIHSPRYLVLRCNMV